MSEGNISGNPALHMEDLNEKHHIHVSGRIIRIFYCTVPIVSGMFVIYNISDPLALSGVTGPCLVYSLTPDKGNESSLQNAVYSLNTMRQWVTSNTADIFVQ
jgi:hypothetical protein